MMNTAKKNCQGFVIGCWVVAPLPLNTRIFLPAHLWGIIFSVVSPSVMVTLRLLMYAPLWLDGE